MNPALFETQQRAEGLIDAYRTLFETELRHGTILSSIDLVPGASPTWDELRMCHDLAPGGPGSVLRVLIEHGLSRPEADAVHFCLSPEGALQWGALLVGYALAASANENCKPGPG